jgi:hypothetical protein
MNLENIMHNEINKTQKDKYCIHYLNLYVTFQKIKLIKSERGSEVVARVLEGE